MLANLILASLSLANEPIGLKGMAVFSHACVPLKGPKREIFGLGIFAQIRPIWIGYKGTRPKNLKKLRFGPYIALYFPRFLC